jgi:uncharacterized protein YjiK
MKQYKVISFKSPSPSFSWNDGLFAILETKDDVITMVKIDKNGQPNRFDNGEFMLTEINVRNTGVTETSLILNIN